MNNDIFENFIKNKVIDFSSGEMDFSLLSKYKQLINDNYYFDFVISSKNCGFFYEQSLHLYGYSSLNKFNDIDYINSLLQNEYGHIIHGLISFGQDLFGNQFCFDMAKRGVVFFNSETGEKEAIASDYENWVNTLYNQLEYFTGINVLRTWLLNNQFNFDQRLCPKIPFIMGGEFEINNLYASIFPDFITAYANIARQVHDLPDGTQVRLNIGKK